LRRHLVAATRERAGVMRDRLARVERRLAAVAPAARLAQRRARFEELRDRLTRSVPSAMQRRAVRLEGGANRLDTTMGRVIERGRARLQLVETALGGNNPEAILQRGYAIVTDESGRPLLDAAAAPPGSRITAQLARGRLAARVEAEGSDGRRQIGLF